MITTPLLQFGDLRFDPTSPDADRRPREAVLPILRAFLTDTAARCAYHRARFARARFDPDTLRTLNDLTRLPTLGPDDLTAVPGYKLLPDTLVEGFRGGLSAVLPDERIELKATTSGSTGTPKCSYYTRADFDVLCAMFERILQHIPQEDYARVFQTWINPPTGHWISNAFNRLGAVVELRHHTAVEPERVLEQMRRSDVTDHGGFCALATPPCTPKGAVKKGSTLDELLLADVDNQLGALRLVVTMGHPRDLPELRLKARVWEANELAGAPPARFVDVYSCVEAAPMAAECEADDGVHLLDGPSYVEVIDERTGRHVRNGERGLIVATSMRHGSRYVRYMPGDEALYVDEPCRCGRSTARLKDIARVMERSRLVGGCAAGL